MNGIFRFQIGKIRTFLGNALTNFVDGVVGCLQQTANFLIRNFRIIDQNPQNSGLFFASLCRRKNFFSLGIMFTHVVFQLIRHQICRGVGFATVNFFPRKLTVVYRTHALNIGSDITVGNCLNFQLMNLAKICYLSKS